LRILKLAAFDKFAQKQDIPDDALHDAVERAEKGLIDADLGDGVIKQRIARKGEGKRGGFRTVIIFRSMERAFFVYGFAKNERDNIPKNDVTTIKKLAPFLLDLPENGVDELIKDGAYLEVKQNGKTV
jgi:hypothetical protein